MKSGNRVAILRDEIFRKHVNSPGHPESPARLEAIDRAVLLHEDKALFDSVGARRATEKEIGRVHSQALIDRVAESENHEHTDFDYETAGNRFSFAAAATAAGAAIGAVDEVMADPSRPAYAVVRPPGHHAERSQVMGFCLFNNVAIAAEYARHKLGLEKIFIYDWDVHHGNGTMHSFYDRNDVLYASAHQFPHYPGTGSVVEIGEGDGAGYTLNVPVPPGCGDPDYRYAMAEIILPAIRHYKPDLILVSAGYDAHTDDPLSAINLTSEMYGDMTYMLRQAAEEVCSGRLAMVLEGGYGIESLEDSNRCVLHALCGTWESRSPNGFAVDPGVSRVVSRLKELLDL